MLVRTAYPDFPPSRCSRLGPSRLRPSLQVDVLLKRLALTQCADVRIGDPLSKGISGGQAKRTNVSA